jgi:DNA-binding transcriptional regulator LsrR (DeoR family)
MARPPSRNLTEKSATPGTDRRRSPSRARSRGARPTGSVPLTAREKFSAVLAQFREGVTSIDKAVEKIRHQFPGIELTREEVYPLLRTGLAEGYVTLAPERDQEMERRLINDFGLRGAAIVPSVYFPDVAMRAARQILQIIGEFMKLGKRKIGIGFASGFSISHVARALANLLRTTGLQLPNELQFHALSVGFNPAFLREDPNFFLAAFEPLADVLRLRALETARNREHTERVRFIGLYAPSIIPTRQLSDIRGMEGIKEAIAVASEIDIVVTSASDFNDKTSTLAAFYESRPEEVTLLANAGCKGHLLYLPLAETGPIPADKHQFILPTIWSLEELHAITTNFGSNREHPARVVLVAGLTKEMKPKRIISTILKQQKALITDLITDQQNGKAIYSINTEES